MIDPVREGELIAQRAEYQKDQMIEDFRAANIAHCALLLSTDPSEEQIARGEQYGRQGDALRTAIGITVETQRSRPSSQEKPARRFSLVALLHRHAQPA